MGKLKERKRTGRVETVEDGNQKAVQQRIGVGEIGAVKGMCSCVRVTRVLKRHACVSC